MDMLLKGIRAKHTDPINKIPFHTWTRNENKNKTIQNRNKNIDGNYH